MFKNYIKIAIRSLLKQKAYSLINLTGLAIGLACAILILVFIQHERSYDRFHEKADNLYRAITVQKLAQGGFKKTAIHPAPMRDAVIREIPEIEKAVMMVSARGTIVRSQDKVLAQSILYANRNFFDMFTFPLLNGNPKTALELPNAIVISKTTAETYFGDEDPIGKTFTLTVSEQNYKHIVTGVAKDSPANSSIKFDFLAPIESYPWWGSEHFFANWNSSQCQLYVELSGRSTAGEVEAKFKPLVQKYLGQRIHSNQREGYLISGDDAWQVLLQPIEEVHFTPDIRFGLEPASNPTYLYVLLGIAILVLFIACTNFTTLAIGQSTSRAREVGMRKVLGARRVQLMRQFWGEAILLTLVATLLGIAFAELFLPAFNSIVAKNLDIEYWKNWQTGLGLIALVALTGVLAGSYPALLLSGFKPVDVLKNISIVSSLVKSNLKSGLLRKGLVVAQFTLSILFIICTFIMLKQLSFMRNKELGFNKDMVLAVRAYSRDLESIQILERFRNRAGSYPKVQSISGGTVSFNRGWSIQRWNADGQPREVWEFRVDPNYAETLEIKMREGRFFNSEISSDVNNAVVVNETLVKELGWQYPVVGKELRGWGTEVLSAESDPVIVGIIKDFHFSSLRESIQPMVFHMTPDWPIRFILVRISPDDMAGTIKLLESVWREVHPNAPFDYSFIDADIANQYLEEERWGQILRYTSIFAVLIASLGLLGLSSLSVARRTKEIGIRKVLGASVQNIAGLVSREFLKLVAIANLFAWPLAWYSMSRWLENYAYRIEIGWLLFAAAGMLTLSVALLTVGAQAVKAATANPVEALRYE